MPDPGTYNIRLKLLSENNVILAKCDGLETEVFMPALIDGQISLINVIPQKRCRCISTVLMVARKTQFNQTEKSLSYTLNNWKVPMSVDKKKKIPLAVSTPAQFDRLKANNMTEMTITQDLPSIEQMRHASPIENTSFIAPIKKIPKQLQFENIEDIPPMQREISILSDDRYDFSLVRSESQKRNLSNVDLPRTTPKIMPKYNRNDTLELSKMLSAKCTKWQKVITPIRTYARRKYTFESPPTVRLSSKRTDGRAGSHSLLLKTFKVVIDEKTAISPKSLKQQMTKEATKHLEGQKPSTINRNEELNKTTALDLLTTPSRNPTFLSKCLFDQFRRQCVKKVSETDPKYQKICAISPIKRKTKSNIKVPHHLQNVRVLQPEEIGRSQGLQYTHNIEQIQTNFQTPSSSHSQATLKS